MGVGSGRTRQGAPEAAHCRGWMFALRYQAPVLNMFFAASGLTADCCLVTTVGAEKTNPA